MNLAKCSECGKEVDEIIATKLEIEGRNIISIHIKLEAYHKDLYQN